MDISATAASNLTVNFVYLSLASPQLSGSVILKRLSILIEFLAIWESETKPLKGPKTREHAVLLLILQITVI